MFDLAADFKDESEALYGLLEPLSEDDLFRPTRFKDWSPNDVVGHLHLWNVAADLSYTDEAGFEALMADLLPKIIGGQSHVEVTTEWLDGLKGRELLEAWRNFYLPMSEHFAKADPKARVKWAGPDMSVRSSITARLMETWSHGQAVYDLLGVKRVNTDRIKNIAVLGVNTFGWTFKNRKLELPGEPPYVKLGAPSGAVWEWNEPNGENFVEGSAEEFCQVVTQSRALGDTSLQVVGDPATQWMTIAQCFAGQPETPPEAGWRKRETG